MRSRSSLRWAVAAVALVLAGHSMTAEISKSAPPPTKYKLQDVSFRLERGFCHGECPIYSVEVLGNGTVFYNGERYVRVEGAQSGFIRPDQVLELLSAFYDAGFLELQDMYMYLSKGEPKIDDQGEVSVLHIVTKGSPRTVLTLRLGEFSKEVSYQAKYAPERLIDLANFMDELVDSKRWVSRDPDGDD